MSRLVRGLHRSVSRRWYTPSAVSGAYVGVDELAERAKLAVLCPQRNSVKELLDAAGSVRACRPMLGLFNDIPARQFRSSDARAWAVAGFDFVVNDAEHSGHDGLYGREECEVMVRYGLTPIQRLPREARSAHGDALATGSRGTMRPYGTTLRDALEYVESCDFPRPGSEGQRRHARGAFPVRLGDGTLTFTEESLRDAEAGKTLAVLQFETEEYVLDPTLRREVLEVLATRGQGVSSAAFVGIFDATTRARDPKLLAPAVAELCDEALDLGVAVGGVVGGPTEAEAGIQMLNHMRLGMRLIATPVLASDFALSGAKAAAAPFHTAAKIFAAEQTRTA